MSQNCEVGKREPTKKFRVQASAYFCGKLERKEIVVEDNSRERAVERAFDMLLEWNESHRIDNITEEA